MSERIVIKWRNVSIWGEEKGHNFRNVFMTEKLRWLPVDDSEYLCSFAGQSFTREYLIESDIKWIKVFSTIDAGLQPDWVAVDFRCSCGAWATMGMSWPFHDSTCSFKIGPPPEIKNNDGRQYCWECGEPTRQAGGGAYDVCKNKECSWYDK